MIREMSDVRASAFVLLAIATIVLLTNEFLFDCGRIATLTSASLSVLGLAAFGAVAGLRRSG